MGETLYAFIYLDPANPPREVMLSWDTDGQWRYNAYWGEDLINVGTPGTASRRYIGSLPPTGQWVRLEVAASVMGLEGASIRGMAFSLYDGTATWDTTGTTSTPVAPPPAEVAFSDAVYSVNEAAGSSRDYGQPHGKYRSYLLRRSTIRQPILARLPVSTMPPRVTR